MKAEIVYFSATGTTKKIVKSISQGLNCETHFTDISLSAIRKIYQPVESDLTIVATPIYGERIPRFIYDFLKQIEGNGKPLVAVAVYGNVGFGISLVQFEAYATQNHFRLIAAGTFIGEHTYASKKTPVAYGRPNKNDLEQACEFGRKVRVKFDAGNFKSFIMPKSILPKFITDFPDTGIRFLIQQPSADKLLCNACTACSKICPTGAIDQYSLQIDEQKCIRCYACVKVCPKSARVAKFRLRFFEIIFGYMARGIKENQTFL